MEYVNLKAVVEHGKYHFPAYENAQKYIKQTLTGNISDKFEECISTEFSIKDGKVEVTFVITKCDQDRMSVINNRVLKQMKNMSKRYNKKCYVK